MASVSPDPTSTDAQASSAPLARSSEEPQPMTESTQRSMPPQTSASLQSPDGLQDNSGQLHAQRSESPPPIGPMRTDTTTALAQAQATSATPSSNNLPAAPMPQFTSSAIGPSSEQIATLSAKDEEANGPQLQLTLLLTSGARHPFRLDAKYLAKRNVEIQDNDPMNLSVYKLKELILREWREEWEQKPTSPSYIRLISFGRLLDDKSALKDNRFNAEQPNVLHMTIKPQEFGDEDEGKGGKTSYVHQNDGTERRSPSCRCVVM